MGNLEAESGLKSVIYQNSYKGSVRLTDQQYVNQVNSAGIPIINLFMIQQDLVQLNGLIIQENKIYTTNAKNDVETLEI